MVKKIKNNLIFNKILDGIFEITNTFISNKLNDLNRKSLERLWLVLKPEKETVFKSNLK
jgi:hypothetical protein